MEALESARPAGAAGSHARKNGSDMGWVVVIMTQCHFDAKSWAGRVRSLGEGL